MVSLISETDAKYTVVSSNNCSVGSLFRWFIRIKDYEYTATFTDETLEDILELLKRSDLIAYFIVKEEQLNNDAFTPGRYYKK